MLFPNTYQKHPINYI